MSLFYEKFINLTETMEEPMEVDNKRPKVLTWTEK